MIIAETACLRGIKHMHKHSLDKPDVLNENVPENCNLLLGL